MPSVDTHHVNNILAQFFANLLQLIFGKQFQVVGGIDVSEQWARCDLHVSEWLIWVQKYNN